MLKYLITIRTWWHADLIEFMKAQQHPYVIVPKEEGDVIHCPVCHTDYDLKDKVPARVQHVSIACNNPKCREHMDLTRRADGGWKVEFRDGGGV